MQINTTNILDNSVSNYDNNKIILADVIIKKLSPFFDAVRNQKSRKLKSIINENKLNKKEIIEKKEKIKEMVSQLNNLEIKKNYLNKIHLIIQTGNIKSDSLKKELLIMTKVVDKIDNEKLINNTKKLDNLLNKLLN
jgi:hypothetical protein